MEKLISLEKYTHQGRGEIKTGRYSYQIEQIDYC